MQKKWVLLGIALSLGGSLAFNTSDVSAKAKPVKKAVMTLPAKDYGQWYTYLGSLKKGNKRTYLVGRVNLTKNSKNKTRVALKAYTTTQAKLTNLDYAGSAGIPVKVKHSRLKKRKKLVYKLYFTDYPSTQVKHTSVKVNGKSQEALRFQAEGQTFYALKNLHRAYSWHLNDFAADIFSEF